MRLTSISTRMIESSIKDYSFYLTASAYNFSWYFNGSKLLLILDYDAPIVSLIEEAAPRKFKATICSKSNVTINSRYFELIEDILGVNEDLSEFYKIWQKDKLLSASLVHLRGFRVRRVSPWLGLLIGVCQQNASFKQGWTMLASLYRKLGMKIHVNDWGPTLIPPSPNKILETSYETLKACKLGYRAETIIRIAEKMRNSDLSYYAKYSEEDFVKIKGVGPYTARLALVLSAKKYELAPVDRWLKKIICEVYGVSERDAEREWIRRWSRWGGLAAIITTLALDAEPLTSALRRIRVKHLIPTTANGKMTPLTLWKYF